MILVIGEKQFEFAYHVNSLCDLEQVAGMSLGDVLGLPEYTMLRYMVWAGLLKHHNIPLAEVGDLVEEFLTAKPKGELVKIITESIAAAGFMAAQGKKKAGK